MGWYTDYVKKPARNAGNFAKRHAGKIARDSAVVGAGIAGSLIPGCGPVCGGIAAYATDKWLGEPIERSTKRALDKAGAEADDFVAHLRGGKDAPRPPDMATTVQGNAGAATVRGEYEADKAGSRLPLALAAGAVTTAAVTFLILQRTGRLPWRASDA